MTKAQRGRLVLRGLGILLVGGGLYLACAASCAFGTGLPVVLWMAGVVIGLWGMRHVKA